MTTAFAGKQVLVLDPVATQQLWDASASLLNDTLATLLENKKVVILQTSDIIAHGDRVEQTVAALLRSGFTYKSHVSSEEDAAIMHSIYFTRH